MEQIYQYAQVIDLELSHMIWAGLIGVIGFFLRNELSKIHKDIQKLDGKVDENTVDIAKIKTKLSIE